MFWQIVRLKWEQEALFKRYLMGTKSQSTCYLYKQLLHKCYIKSLQRWLWIQNRLNKKIEKVKTKN